MGVVTGYGVHLFLICLKWWVWSRVWSMSDVDEWVIRY